MANSKESSIIHEVLILCPVRYKTRRGLILINNRSPSEEPHTTDVTLSFSSRYVTPEVSPYSSRILWEEYHMSRQLSIVMQFVYFYFAFFSFIFPHLYCNHWRLWTQGSQLSINHRVKSSLLRCQHCFPLNCGSSNGP